MPTAECFVHRAPLDLLAFGDMTTTVVNEAQTQAAVMSYANDPAGVVRRAPVPVELEAEDAAAPPVIPTQIETTRNGRTRLTNDLRVVNRPQR